MSTDPVIVVQPSSFSAIEVESTTWKLASTQGITAEMLQAVDEVSETMDGSGVEENPLIERQLDVFSSPESLEILKEFDSWDRTHGQEARKKEDFESGSISLRRRLDVRIGKSQIQTREDALREANLQMKIEDPSIADEYLQGPAIETDVND